MKKSNNPPPDSTPKTAEMNHFENELEALKSETIKQWELVSSQLKSSMIALSALDRKKAEEIIELEKTVNELDLNIEKKCESIIALYTPVAKDLRFILSVIKINSNLEKVGDIATRISKFIVKFGEPFYNELIAKTQTLEMFEEACDLFEDALLAFKNNDAEKSRNIFKRDEFINEINKSAFGDVINLIKENPENIEKYLRLLTVVRRIEKAGDISKMIAEEIIFYLEAKVLRHGDR